MKLRSYLQSLGIHVAILHSIAALVLSAYGRAQEESAEDRRVDRRDLDEKIRIIEQYPNVIIGSLSQHKLLGRIPSEIVNPKVGDLIGVDCFWGRIKIDEIVVAQELTTIKFIDIIWSERIYHGAVVTDTARPVPDEFIKPKQAVWLLASFADMGNSVPIVLSGFSIEPKTRDTLLAIDAIRSGSTKSKPLKIQPNEPQPLPPPPK